MCPSLSPGGKPRHHHAQQLTSELSTFQASQSALSSLNSGVKAAAVVWIGEEEEASSWVPGLVKSSSL